MRRSRLFLVLGVSFLMVVGASGVPLNPPAITDQCRIWWGPMIDKIVYDVIPEIDQQILALQNNELDLVGTFVDPSYLPALEAAENIGTAATSTNSYVALAINCEKYPFNLTAFRRAFAYAIDKDAITQDDRGMLPLDSCVTRASPFTIEGMLDYDYYGSQLDTANQILDDAGFLNIDDDDFRESPNGSSLDVLIDYPYTTEQIRSVCEAAASALNDIGINATAVPADSGEHLNRLWFHGDYDISFFRSDFDDLDVLWMAYEYWSEYANEPYYNVPNFRNSSYDSYREALLHSIEYDAVYNAALEMQRIWIYECPMVVCYEELGISVYRTNNYENHVNMPVSGLVNWWSLCRTRLKFDQGGPNGGTFRIGILEEIDSFNPLKSSMWDSGLPMSMMYESLARRNSEGEDVPFLATGWTIETHDDNPSVPENHTRITFQTRATAVWTDGAPLIAEDIVYSINLYRELEGHHLAEGLDDLSAIYSPRPSIVVAEFRTESFWNLHKISYKPILQKQHCLGIEIMEWTPNPYIDEMTTLGPFIVTEHVIGEFTEITYYPYYYYLEPSEIHLYVYPPDLDGSIEQPFSYVEGTTGHAISWYIYGSSLHSWAVYYDSLLYANGIFGVTPDHLLITFNVDGLSIGDHNISLVIYNVNGTVHVWSATIIVESGLAVMLRGFSVATVGTIVIGYYLITRKRA